MMVSFDFANGTQSHIEKLNKKIIRTVKKFTIKMEKIKDKRKNDIV